jgi:hypothetical protein
MNPHSPESSLTNASHQSLIFVLPQSSSSAISKSMPDHTDDLKLT